MCSLPWHPVIRIALARGIAPASVLSNQVRVDETSLFNTVLLSTFERLMDPDIYTGFVPSSKRILQDNEGVWQAMQVVCENKGVFVPDLAARTGCRYLKSLVKHNRGGCRLNGDASILYWKNLSALHADLQSMRIEEMEMRNDDGEDVGGK